MPYLETWRGRRHTSEAAARAAAAWERIQDHARQIILLRGDLDLPAQTVRLEAAQTAAQELSGGAGVAVTQTVVVLGVADHPTVPDLDIRRGDRFVIDGAEYRVVDVNRYPGEVQAFTERSR